MLCSSGACLRGTAVSCSLGRASLRGAGLCREGGEGGPSTTVLNHQVLNHQAEDVRSAQAVGFVHSPLTPYSSFLFQAPHRVWSSRPLVPPVRDSPSVLVFPGRDISRGCGVGSSVARPSAGLDLEPLRGCGVTVTEPCFQHHCDGATLAVSLQWLLVSFRVGPHL